MLTDTHCHIHERQFCSPEETEQQVVRALKNGVTRLIAVGTSEGSSDEAVMFANTYSCGYAVVGVHPHDSTEGVALIEQILKAGHQKVIGVGEIGLDYFYTHSPKEVQRTAFEQQLQWAKDYRLPVSFHVRDAFEDFWPIFANFSGIRGVLHSYTDNLSNLELGLSEGLYIGLNGISTFTKDENQRQMYDSIPLNRILLETDSPFLTPAPHRGKVNEPAFVKHVAEYHANRRQVELEQLARVTSANASNLFSI